MAISDLRVAIIIMLIIPHLSFRRYIQERKYMISAILRVSDEKLDFNKFIKKHDLDTDAVYENRFNLCLFDEDKLSREQFHDYMAEIIAEYGDVFEELRELKINSQIDIGVTVGSDDQFMCSIVLPNEIIKELSKYNIEIAFSAYPASD